MTGGQIGLRASRGKAFALRRLRAAVVTGWRRNPDHAPGAGENRPVAGAGVRAEARAGTERYRTGTAPGGSEGA